MKQWKKKWKKNEKQQQQLVFHHVIATSLNCNLFSDELQPRENSQQKQEKYWQNTQVLRKSGKRDNVGQRLYSQVERKKNRKKLYF